MNKLINLTGKRFGILTVIRRATNDLHGSARWICKCECGETTTRGGSGLRQGRTTSCGCKNRSIKHGMSDTPEYATWRTMIQRCTDPNKDSWHCYGGRGIAVCDRWLHGEGEKHGLECFWADILASVGPRPSPRHSIDRIDNSKGYEPGNVQWATQRQQANNMRVNRRLTFQSRTQTLAQWARELGIPRQAIAARIANGWSIEKALSRPIRGTLTYQGRTQTIQQWTTELKFGRTTIYCRLQRGWTIERALSTPHRDQ